MCADNAQQHMNPKDMNSVELLQQTTIHHLIHAVEAKQKTPEECGAPAAYITHSATQPLTVWLEIQDVLC